MPCELETILIARTQRRLADSGRLTREPWSILSLPRRAIFWHYSLPAMWASVVLFQPRTDAFSVGKFRVSISALVRTESQDMSLEQ